MLHWVALFSLSFAGCSLVNDPGRHMGGGGTDGGTEADARGAPDGGPPPLAAEDACGVLVSAYCEAYENCCAMPVRTRGECETTALQRCQEGVEPYLTDSRTGYDPVLAGALVAEGRALLATCDPAIVRWFTYDLLTAMRGTLARTEVCLTLGQVVDEDYAGIFSCSRDGHLVCRPLSSPIGDWTCQGLSSEMGTCNYLLHCDDGLTCTGSLVFTGMCVPQRGDGVACDVADQCQSLDCVGGACREPDRDIYCTDLIPGPQGGMPAMPAM